MDVPHDQHGIGQNTTTGMENREKGRGNREYNESLYIVCEERLRNEVVDGE